MEVKIEKINIEGIDRNFGTELANEIIRATDNTIFLNNDYPALKILHKLLTNSFSNSVGGVHFLNENKKE